MEKRVNSEDRRNFKRYAKDTEFALKLDSKQFFCRLIDYSAEGISLIILDKTLSLRRGDTFALSMEDPDLEFLGEVVWERPDKEGILVGFRRIGNIKGACQDFRISDIIIGLQRGTRTGVLEVIQGIKVTRIYISDGDLKFANSNVEDDRFGEVLIREGKITLEQYFEMSEKIKKSKKRMGQLLIESGYLEPNELLPAVRHQVEEIIVSIMSAECGRFEFKEGPLPTDEPITLNLSAANLIYRGIKRVNSFQYILADFPQLESVFYLSDDPLDLFQDLFLDDVDKEILSLIRGKATAKKILANSPTGEFETIKTLYALLSARIITVTRGDVESSVMPEEVIQEASLEIDPEFLKRVDALSESCETMGYYALLGVHRSSSKSDIKKAYFNVAREFHPDRHFSVQSEDIKSKLNDIFAHATIAYKTLSDPKKRNEYDKGLYVEPSRTISSVDRARDHFNKGKSKLWSNNVVEAEKLFSEAIYLDGSKASYHYYHGVALGKLKRFKDAAKAFGKSVDLNPQEAQYLAELGHAFLNLGFHKRAKGMFEKALEISESDDRAKEGLKTLEKM
jgi:curved DNA-binding protein CbpA